jgi:hypothetical protein
MWSSNPRNTHQAQRPDNPQASGFSSGRLAHRTGNPFEDNDRFLKLVQQIGSYGLPVAFLPPLAKSFAIYMESSRNAVHPIIHSIDLKASTSEEVEKYLSPQGKRVADIDLGLIYHECTHAFLANVGRDEQVARVIRQGMTYYTDASLEKKRTASDPEEVFQEAAAGYVGGRVTVYWAALAYLVKAGMSALSMPGPVRVARFLDGVEQRREQYDHDMSRRVFGYETVDGHQVETTKAISPELKAFLDERILEGKMPDHFNDVVAFQNIVDGVVELRMGKPGQM